VEMRHKNPLENERAKLVQRTHQILGERVTDRCFELHDFLAFLL
jgi:hypothetical protein